MPYEGVLGVVLGIHGIHDGIIPFRFCYGLKQDESLAVQEHSQYIDKALVTSACWDVARTNCLKASKLGKWYPVFPSLRIMGQGYTIQRLGRFRKSASS